MGQNLVRLVLFAFLFTKNKDSPSKDVK